MLSVYEYSDPARYLKDAWELKRTKNSAFSLRAWSKTLGLEGHSPLHLMLAGKRPIPRKYIPSFIKSLSMSPKEGLFFENLVELQRARGTENKEFYLRRLKEMTPGKTIRFFELENFKFFGNPIHMAIIEMTDLKDFQPTALWIQKRLRIKAHLREIDEAVERLIGLGLLAESEDGKLRRTQAHLDTKPDTLDRGVQEYHRNILKLASELLPVLPLSEREYGGYSLNLHRAALPRAKQMIREFIKNFIRELEAPPGSIRQTELKLIS